MRQYHLIHCALASGAVYRNRPCLFVCLWVRGVGLLPHNSKLRASILTKLGL